MLKKYRLLFSELPLIVYDNRADMILSVRCRHRNKSVHIHEKSSFPKDCDEYTTEQFE